MNGKISVKGIIIMTLLIIASVMFLNMSLAVNSAKVIVETANLRETASSEAKILDQMSKDEEVEIIENSGEWCQVKYKGITGYTKTTLLSVSDNNQENKNAEENNTKAEENTTTATTQVEEQKEQNVELGKYAVIENTKLKLVPLINATDMIELKKDDEINVVKVMNGWAYIEANTTRGWIRKEKIKSEAQIKLEEDAAKQKAEEDAAKQKEEEANSKAIKTLYVKSESVNLRKEANASSELVGNIPQNTTVEVISEENGWSKCKVSGLEGYISTQYLSETKTEVTSRNSTEARIGTSSPIANTEELASSANSGGLVEYAKQFLGCSYVYGGNGPSSFDCSGFTSYVFSHYGVTLQRTAQGQLNNGSPVSNLQEGDLVLFGSSTNNIWHVGIYIGGNRFIHAANPSRGVTTDSLASGYYADNYVAARRVL